MYETENKRKKKGEMKMAKKISRRLALDFLTKKKKVKGGYSLIAFGKDLKSDSGKTIAKAGDILGLGTLMDTSKKHKKGKDYIFF